MYNTPLQRFTPKGHHVGIWNARAIFLPQFENSIDLLPDRQNSQGVHSTAFDVWLNQRGLPELRRLLKERGIERDSGEVIEVNEFSFRLVASPKRSHGYLYIDAMELPVVNLGVGNSGSNLHCTIYSVDDVSVMWSSYNPIPKVGAEIEVSTSWGRQTGTVEGYYVGGGYLNALTRLASPPKGFVENIYIYEVGKVQKAIRSASMSSTTEYGFPHIEKAIKQATDRRLRELGLLPKTAGMKKIKATALYFAAGVDLVKPEPVAA